MEENGSTGGPVNFVNTNQWVHYASTMAAGGQMNTTIGYFNGVPFAVGTNSYALSTASGQLVIGGVPGALGIAALIGSLDEFRISNTNRSADYLLASYNTQAFPSTFVSVSSQLTSSPTTSRSMSGYTRIEPYGLGESYGNSAATTVSSVINSTTATFMQVVDQSVFPLVPFRVLVKYSPVY